MRIYQEAYGNFLGIFVLKSTHVEVQIARKGVCIAQEIQENVKRTKTTGKRPKT